MTAGRHRLDGQRRDALRAWLARLPLNPRRLFPAAGGAPGRSPADGAPEAPAPPIPVPGAGASPQDCPGPETRRARNAARSGPGQQSRRDTWVRALRRAAKNLLRAAGGRLCARRATFAAGSWLSELGWRLSGPFAMAAPPPVPPRLRAAAPGGPAAPEFPGGQPATWTVPRDGAPAMPRRLAGRETLAFPVAGGSALVRPSYRRWEAWRDRTAEIPERATGPETARLLRGMLAGAA